MPKITVAVLTVSDSAVAGTREDLSGPALAARCDELGWLVVERAVVADEESDIYDTIVRWADAQAATLILTTGGTGVAQRDVTPEATLRAVERQIPGLAELMRLEGRAQTKFSILSRGVVGSRANSLVVNLPGSPQGAVFSLNLIAGHIPHVADLLAGRTGH
ncbi:MAG: MogA/MoaB family molybdenum cofactor biosynthesis protein [Bryobacteraceae bacterium]